MADKTFDEAWDDLSRAVRSTLIQWGPRGFLLRMLGLLAVAELVFVVIPWVWGGAF